MRLRASASRVFLALGVIANASAQQVTVKAFIPYAGPSELDALYESFEADVLSTTGGAVVAAMDTMETPIADPDKRVTITIGPHTFRQDYSTVQVSDNNGVEFTLSSHYFYDCTFEGCPEATTASCTYDNGHTGTDSTAASGTTTFGADELTFGTFALATPLPKALEDECEGDAGDHDLEDESADDEDENENEDGNENEEDQPDAAGRALMPRLSLLPGLVLGLVI